MLRTEELGEATEQLYSAFSKYGLRPDTEPCPCCHAPGDEGVVHRKPLRELTARDLRQFADDALYVWGGLADFKHFLPRILELLAINDEAFSFVDPQAVFAKLIYDTHWHTWPADERAAVAGYFSAVWKAVIQTPPEELGFEDAYAWICAISQAEHDISSYLDAWLRSSSVNAARNLAATITQEGLPNLPKPAAGYWDQCREQWQQLVEWLRLPAVRKKLEGAVDKWAAEPFGGEFYDAAVLLP